MLLITLAGCAGGDGDQTAPVSSTTPTTTTTTTVDVEALGTYCELLVEDERRFADLRRRYPGQTVEERARRFEEDSARLHERMRELAPPEYAAAVDLVLDALAARAATGAEFPAGYDAAAERVRELDDTCSR